MAKKLPDGKCGCVDDTTFDGTDCIVDAGFDSEGCPAGKLSSLGNCEQDCHPSCLSCDTADPNACDACYAPIALVGNLC